MELTYEEKLKLGDTQEHLRIVLENVRIANNQLVAYLNLIEEANNKVVELEKQKEELSKKIIEESSVHEEKTIALNKRESSVSKREESIDTREKEVLEKIAKATKELEGINREINLAKSRYEKSKSDKEREIKTLEEKISTHTDKIREHEETIKNKLRNKKSIEDEIIGLTSSKERAEKELSDFINTSNSEMQKINQSIAEEREKVKNPVELMKLETQKLQTLKEDLDVIKARLTEQFKLQNPDKQLPIELQSK